MTRTPRTLTGVVGSVRTEMYRGREHLVFPIVAMVEGVVQAVNAPTAERVTAAALNAAAHTFNGRPLVFGHPKDHSNGQMRSANDAATWESAIGQIFNARLFNHKLVVDAYVDPLKAESVGGPEFVRQLRDGSQPLEVSIGAWVQTDGIAGTHQGTAYGTSWVAATGDHLAFVGRGACDIAMGCGSHRAASAHQLTPGTPWPSTLTKEQVATELRKAVADHSAAHPIADPYATARPKDASLPRDYQPFGTPPNPYATKEQP